MRVVVEDAAGTGVEELIERRRRYGLDRNDEVWEGEYHMVPGPSGPQADVDAQLVALLWRRCQELGLHYTTATNIGLTAKNYRVPDGAVFEAAPLGTFQSTALMVVEILSPGDATFDKFDFYASRGVQECLVVDPRARSVEVYFLPSGREGRVDFSDVLRMLADALQRAITRPSR